MCDQTLNKRLALKALHIISEYRAGKVPLQYITNGLLSIVLDLMEPPMPDDQRKAFFNAWEDLEIPLATNEEEKRSNEIGDALNKLEHIFSNIDG